MIGELLERQINELDFEEPRLSRMLPGLDSQPESPLAKKIGVIRARQLQGVVTAIDEQELPLDDSQALLAYKILVDVSNDPKSILEIVYGRPVRNLDFRTWRDRGLTELQYEFRKLQQALETPNQNGQNGHKSLV